MFSGNDSLSIFLYDKSLGFYSPLSSYFPSSSFVSLYLAAFDLGPFFLPPLIAIFSCCPPLLLPFPIHWYVSTTVIPPPPFTVVSTIALRPTGGDGHSAQGVVTPQPPGQLHQPDAGGEGARGGRDHRWEEESQQGVKRCPFSQYFATQKSSLSIDIKPAYHIQSKKRKISKWIPVNVSDVLWDHL